MSVAVRVEETITSSRLSTLVASSVHPGVDASTVASSTGAAPAHRAIGIPGDSRRRHARQQESVVALLADGLNHTGCKPRFAPDPFGHATNPVHRRIVPALQH